MKFQILGVLAVLVSMSLAAPSHHHHGGQVDPGFNGPSGQDLGGIHVVDPNNPDPGFNGPSSGGNLGGIHVVDGQNPDPGFNGPHHG